MAPFPIETILGKAGALSVFLFIGVAFGWVLENAGFGKSTKLAAQFYFREMTVLKVMFTAIVVAMVLIFATSGLGLLDYNRLWVNPTYLWPGVLGGLIMGVGFIVGGFCPGTSLVAVATLKIDGLFFFIGSALGVFLFGETVNQYASFFHSSFMGRFTLPELFGLPTGTVVFLVILMALFMFWGAEKLEGIFGDQEAEPRRCVHEAPLCARRWTPRSRACLSWVWDSLQRWTDGRRWLLKSRSSSTSARCIFTRPSF